MGTTIGTSRRVVPSEEINTTRKDFTISKDRSVTDVCFLLFFILFILGLVCLFLINVFYEEIIQIVNGPILDSCKNGCNISNLQSVEIMTLCANMSFLNALYINQYFMITNINMNSTIFQTEIFQEFIYELVEDIRNCYMEFFILVLTGLGTSILILVIYRYFIASIILVLCWGTICVCLTMTITLWLIWWGSQTTDSQKSERRTNTYLIFSLIASVVTILISTILFAVRRRIGLMIKLFEQSGKALSDMPLLLFQPVLTLLWLSLIMGFGFYYYIILEELSICSKNHTREFQTLRLATKWYLLFALVWLCNFIIGCQHMIIAGSISQWYFKRNKHLEGTKLIIKAYHNLIRYHLGSVAFGSFLIASFEVVRLILKVLYKFWNKSKIKCLQRHYFCCNCCSFFLDNILKYLNRNAYVEIAINGHNFWKANKAAFNLLSSQVLLIAIIKSIGYFILLLGKTAAVTVAVVISIYVLRNCQIHQIWVPVTFIGLFTFFMSCCFMTVYEVSIDTILLCFCEDFVNNNGISKPSFISGELLKFVGNSKRIYKSIQTKRNTIYAISKTNENLVDI